MIVQEILTAPSNNPREELDAILAELCELAINSHEKDPKYYGLVASCVICPDGQRIYGVNHEKDGLRVHAERDALDRCANPGPECIVVTTCSPCNTGRKPNHMKRYGEDCQDLLDQYGIEHVYCGYKNPEEEPDSSIETQNPKLRKLCKRFADTFLKENIDPVSGRGAVAPTMPPRPKPELKVKPVASAVRVDINKNKNDPYAQTYKKPVEENFADGKGPGRAGDSQRHGIPKGATMAELEKASHSAGRKGELARWQLNMRRGKKK